MSFNPFKPFASYLRPYRWALAIGLAFLLGEQLISVSIPLVLERAIDQARASLDQAAPDLTFLTHYAALIVGLGLAQWCMAFGMRWHLASTSYRVERDIRQRYFAHLLTLPIGYFQQARTGDLMARATNDVEAVQRYLSHGFRMFLSAILGFSLSMVAMCLYDWELTLYALLPMPIMTVILRLVGSKVRERYRMVQEQFAAISTCLQENLSGVRVVKAFARRRGEIDHFTRLNDEYVERSRSLIYLYSTFFPFTFLISGLSMVFILWLGGIRVVEGTLTLGAFVAFNAYLIRMSRPMMMMGRIVDEYQRAMASMLRIESVLKEQPQPTSTETMAQQSKAKSNSAAPPLRTMAKPCCAISTFTFRPAAPSPSSAGSVRARAPWPGSSPASSKSARVKFSSTANPLNKCRCAPFATPSATCRRTPSCSPKASATTSPSTWPRRTTSNAPLRWPN